MLTKSTYIISINTSDLDLSKSLRVILDQFNGSVFTTTSRRHLFSKLSEDLSNLGIHEYSATPLNDFISQLNDKRPIHEHTVLAYAHVEIVP